MSEQEPRETRTREELFAALTAGAGLLVQGFVGLGGALHRVAQAFEDLAKVIENQLLAEMERDLDVMMEDDERVPMETESDDLDDPPDYDHTDESDTPPGEPPVNP